MKQSLLDPPMAKKTKVEEDDSQPTRTATTKIDPELKRKAKVVATHKGLELGEYIDRVLRATVEGDYRRMFQQERDT